MVLHESQSDRSLFHFHPEVRTRWREIEHSLVACTGCPAKQSMNFSSRFGESFKTKNIVFIQNIFSFNPLKAASACNKRVLKFYVCFFIALFFGFQIIIEFLFRWKNCQWSEVIFFYRLPINPALNSYILIVVIESRVTRPAFFMASDNRLVRKVRVESAKACAIPDLLCSLRTFGISYWIRDSFPPYPPSRLYHLTFLLLAAMRTTSSSGIYPYRELKGIGPSGRKPNFQPCWRTST